MKKKCLNCKFAKNDSGAEPCYDCSLCNKWVPVVDNDEKKCDICGEFKNLHYGRCSATTELNDNVNKPPHYRQGNIETIDYIQDKLTKEEFIGAMKFNILKYVSRERLKNGIEDIRKAQFYVNKLIQVMEEK